MSYKAPVIKRTDTYDRFTFLESNRPVVESHVRHLMALIEANDELHLNPVIVTPDMGIIDGQHRFEAARRLNKSFYYIESDGDAGRVDQQLVECNNSQRCWRLSDYVHHHAACGRDGYAQLQEMSRDTGWSVSVCLTWMQGALGSTNRGKVKRGVAKAILFDAPRLAFVPLAKQICDILISQKQRPVANAERFHVALAQFLETPGVDGKRLLGQFERYGYLMGTRGTRRAYSDLICSVWNYRKVGGIRFRVDEYGGAMNYIQIGDSDA